MEKVKTIEINTEYIPNIENIKNERKRTKEIIKNIYERFINEKNYNNRDGALEALENYRYVENKYVIPNGRYIRYIDTTDSEDMPLKLGGFVLNDNKYSITFKSAGEAQRIVKLNKRHCIMFVYITDTEKLRSELS